MIAPSCSSVTWVALCTLLAGNSAVGRAAPKGPHEAVQWVLPPSTAGVLQNALRRAGPPLKLDGAQIKPRFVAIKVCVNGPCYRLRLTYPGPDCTSSGGTVCGPWCVHALGKALPEPWRQRLNLAFAADRLDRVWVAAGRAGHAPILIAPHQAHRSNAYAYLWAVLYLVLPLLLGLTVGWGLHRLLKRPLSSRGSAAALLGGPLLVAVISARWTAVGLWDLLLLAALLGGGLLLGLHRLARRQRWSNGVLLAGSMLVSLCILELGTRLLLPPPPAFPPARQIRLVPTMFSRSDAASWVGLFPRRYGAQLRRRTRSVTPTSRVVLHVGDSLVFGSGVRSELRFTALLNGGVTKGAVAYRHLNAGFPGTGTDFHHLVIKRWTRVRPVRHVLHYVFVGNDVRDMDRPFLICRDGPLLRYGPQGPVPRCHQPRWGLAARRPLLSGPAPYPLRVATSFSVAARHLCARLWQLAVSFTHVVDMRVAWRHFESVLKATRDDLKSRGIGYTVVVLPVRGHLERLHLHPDARTYRSILRICRRLYIQVLNPFEVLERHVRQHTSGRYFINDPTDDPHFNPTGHRLIARWLRKQLPRVLSPLAGRPPPSAR